MLSGPELRRISFIFSRESNDANREGRLEKKRGGPSNWQGRKKDTIFHQRRKKQFPLKKVGRRRQIPVHPFLFQKQVHITWDCFVFSEFSGVGKVTGMSHKYITTRICIENDSVRYFHIHYVT